jgi:thiamine biosynthesis protein ThiS
LIDLPLRYTDCENPIEMKLQINGEARDFTFPLSLASLLEQLGMKQDRVAVELNRNIVPREQWSDTSLGEGDRLEIVQFVGGGCPQAPDSQELL